MLWTDLGRLSRNFDPWFEIDRPMNPWERPATFPAMKESEFPLVNIWVNGDGSRSYHGDTGDRAKSSGSIGGRQKRKPQRFAPGGTGGSWRDVS